MIFSYEFLDEFRTDPINKMTEIVSIIRPLISPITGDWTDADFDVLLEAYALVVEALEAKLLPFDEYPILSGTPEIDCNIIYKFLKDIETECIAEATRLKVESLRNRFRISMNSTFSYEFSQGDLERVQLLINELRSQISSLHSLESDHRQRLLKRLEKLQSELHKKVSDLDRFWGLVGDAGVVLGKLGKDAKPIVDRIREIANIVWQTQSRAEELPSGTQLPLSEPKPNLTNNEQT